MSTIADTVAMLRDLRISVDFTNRPVEFDFAQTREDGRVPATVGLITVTHNGRAFVELYDSTDHLREQMLAAVARDVEHAIATGHTSTYLHCALRPETVLELREWAELRDGLQAVA